MFRRRIGRSSRVGDEQRPAAEAVRARPAATSATVTSSYPRGQQGGDVLEAAEGVGRGVDGEEVARVRGHRLVAPAADLDLDRARGTSVLRRRCRPRPPLVSAAQ